MCGFKKINIIKVTFIFAKMIFSSQPMAHYKEVCWVPSPNHHTHFLLLPLRLGSLLVCCFVEFMADIARVTLGLTRPGPSNAPKVRRTHQILCSSTCSSHFFGSALVCLSFFGFKGLNVRLYIVKINGLRASLEMFI